MREIVERAGSRELELIDGVKVIDGDRWALVLPDPDEALTHVWAEAGSDVDARRLAQEYVQRIRQVAPVASRPMEIAELDGRRSARTSPRCRSGS